LPNCSCWSSPHRACRAEPDLAFLRLEALAIWRHISTSAWLSISRVVWRIDIAFRPFDAGFQGVEIGIGKSPVIGVA
jgi:hypothetical protein